MGRSELFSTSDNVDATYSNQVSKEEEAIKLICAKGERRRELEEAIHEGVQKAGKG